MQLGGKRGPANKPGHANHLGLGALQERAWSGLNAARERARRDAAAITQLSIKCYWPG